MHEARVIVSSKGETIYNDIIQVRPSIETNYSFIDIIGNEKYEKDFYTRYTNEYQKFNFIAGTLVIKAEDRWGNSIEIDVTAV